ncbi:MAG TPA: GTPase Era [bacterium]|nr:GTPase Era [bacterium]
MRSGFVALAGAPGAGKSALLNRLVGRKVAISGAAPQTTRTRSRGILTRPDLQIIFVDTPGVHPARHRLGAQMMSEVREALADADAALAVFDLTRPLGADDRRAAALVRALRKPAVAALTKADLAPPAQIAVRAAEAQALAPFAAVVPVSAARGDGIAALLDALAALLPEGPQYFPAEMVTDRSEAFLVRELIREQAIALTRDELPHGIAVELDEVAERSATLTYIRATVHVARPSHRKMLIGREGRRLREIGRRARLEIERLLGRRVFLDLWVKVSPDWPDRAAVLRTLHPPQE